MPMRPYGHNESKCMCGCCSSAAPSRHRNMASHKRRHARRLANQQARHHARTEIHQALTNPDA